MTNHKSDIRLDFYLNPRSHRCDPRHYFTVEVLVVKLFTLLALYIYDYMYDRIFLIHLKISLYSSILVFAWLSLAGRETSIKFCSTF